MKILVIDDHHLIRQGLRPLLEQLAAVGEAVEIFEAESLAKGLAIADGAPDLDLALLDLRLPDVIGFESVSSLRARHPALPIVLMSGDDEPGLARKALDHGVLGFIPKASSPQLIVGALRVVLAGGTYMPREAMDGVERPASRAGKDPQGGLGLTPRQSAVLSLILAGKSNKVIGRELALAEGTVKNHVAAVLKALNVTTRTQAVIAAAKRGIKA